MNVRALLLSLLGPGVGHALQGRPLRGLVWFAVVFLCLLSSPWTGIVGIGVGLLGYLGAMIDAALLQRHESHSSAALWVFLVGWMASAVGIRLFYMESFKIPSAAMLPTM